MLLREKRRDMAQSRSNKKFPLLGLPVILGLLLFVLGFWISGLFEVRLQRTMLLDANAYVGRRYLYWGWRVDCPGKICQECGGLGHQESSLRCALEEAMFLNRTFVLPSRLCIVGKHNAKGLLDHSASNGSAERWEDSTCSVESLYDIKLMSKTVSVITDSSKEWISMLSRRGSILDIKGITRQELMQNSKYRNTEVINRTANHLAWFVECKDRLNHSAVALPYSFLPSMAARPLRIAAQQISSMLHDYDAIHVRRGDVLRLRKDGLGQLRTKFPHLDRDTHPEGIMRRIATWVPAGRTLYIASNENKPGFFDPLRSKYNVVQASNFTNLLKPVISNNYQLFMVERLIVAGAKTIIKTFHEVPGDLSLTDDVKKVRVWLKPVYTFDDNSSIQ